MIGKRLINTGAAAADAVFTPSEHFNTVLYTGNGSTQRIGGYINRGGVFNGSSSHIDIGDVIPNTDTDYSVSTWINIDSGFTSGNRTILGAASSSSGTEGSFRLQLTYVSANTYKITIARTVATSGTNFYYSSSWTASSINTGQWYHIVATYNSTGRVGKTYLNGAAVDSSALTSSASVSSVNNDLIGGQRTNTAKWLGKIDQFRIFNKVLSQQEVTTLSNETHASTTISTTDIFNDNSAVALYQLDGNANDTGGVSGKFGSAAIFNGSSSSVGNTSIDTATTKAVSLWVNADDFSERWPFQQGDGQGVENYIRFYNTDDIQIRWGNVTQTFSGYSSNTWYHIVAQTDASGNANVWINGAEVGTSTAPSTLTVDSTNIGRRKNATSWQNYFKGRIDDVRIYSDTLTDTEIGYLYNNTTNSIPTDNLTAFYKFNGDARDEQQLYDGTASNVTYAYDGTATNVTYQEATNFTPDLVWVKSRSFVENHAIFDSVRGVQEEINSNRTNAESTKTNALSSFNSSGFTTGANNALNANNEDYAAWCFNAGEGAAATNNDGTIASTVKANQDAGFSIVNFTSIFNVTQTAGHGLSSTPEMIIIKHVDDASNWYVWTKDLTSGNSLALNLTRAQNTDLSFTVNPTTFTTNWTNTSRDYIAYCFHSVDGYQKVGSYTGNGGVNHIETDFEPAWIMIKPTSVADNWLIYDNKRGKDIALFANLSNGDTTYSGRLSFASDGFVIDSSNDGWNGNNETYIYLAIAADPDTTTPTVENSFDVVTYTGNGGTQSIATDFKPDFVWIKARDFASSHELHDSVRGEPSRIFTNNTNAASTNYDGFVSLDSNGFSLDGTGGGGSVNDTNSYVAWCWKAGDHDDDLPQINTEGSIDSVVSVNAEAGFSIVKYTGTGLAVNNTIGHGLSSAPEMIILKRLNSTNPWIVYHTAMGTGKHMELNSTGGESGTGSLFGYPADVGVAPTSTVFTVGVSSSSNASSSPFIAYCFHSVTGYQKIGSYSGSSSSVEETVGFQPRFVLIKNVDAVRRWVIFDSVRNNFGSYLDPSDTLVEQTDSSIAITVTSTSFILPAGANYTINSSSYDYIYLAIK
jgi:hypothetical protein